ncbi:putative structural maintenance of chromosome (SMC) family protein [Diplonema papillatum]|nr:putative structural maintenance of chromosome (SMC) family protein [Diplonema papillatum]
MVEKLEKLLLVNPNVEEVSLNNEGIDDLLPLVPLLSKMPNLKVLKLANNNIQKLPEDLSSLRSVQYLDISHNPIPGLGSIFRGLFSLNGLKHLYVDMPYETDEEEIIVSLTSLESFNGTPLTDNGDEDLGDLDDAGADSPGQAYGGLGGPLSHSNVAPPRPQQVQAWHQSVSPGDRMSGNTPPLAHSGSPPGYGGASHLPSLRSRYTGPGGRGSIGRGNADDYNPKINWDPNDMEEIQRLYRAANSVSGRIANKVEFEDYVKNIIAHLHTLLAGEDDPYKKEAEILKVKKIMFEYCFEEISRSSYRFDSNLSTVLTTLQETYGSLLGNYDNLIKSMQSHKDKKLEVMRTDMQHAIQEIEQLMQQMDAKDSYGGGRAPDGDTAQMLNEIGWLRSENEKLQARLRQYEVGRQKLASQIGDGMDSHWADGRPSKGGPKGPSVGRSLTAKQLKEIIEDIYTSKSKFDIKCLETHLPRETMEQHLYTYLNQKYGLKNLILDWAEAIINGVRKHSADDNDVAVFGKILRNEIDEEFRFVQRQLKETVHELLRVYLKGKHPMKGDEEIINLVHKRTAGYMQEEEWVDIVKYMYNAEDSVSIIMRVREVIKEKNPPRRRAGRRNRADPLPREQNSLLYGDFLKVLLDFQLQGHERFLGKFVKLFRQFDADKNGILNEAEFVQLLRAIDPAKTEEEVNALLDLIDPHDNQLINFSECVTFLSSELVKMMSEMKHQHPSD